MDGTNHKTLRRRARLGAAITLAGIGALTVVAGAMNGQPASTSTAIAATPVPTPRPTATPICPVDRRVSVTVELASQPASLFGDLAMEGALARAQNLARQACEKKKVVGQKAPVPRLLSMDVGIDWAGSTADVRVAAAGLRPRPSASPAPTRTPRPGADLAGQWPARFLARGVADYCCVPVP